MVSRVANFTFDADKALTEVQGAPGENAHKVPTKRCFYPQLELSHYCQIM